MLTYGSEVGTITRISAVHVSTLTYHGTYEVPKHNHYLDIMLANVVCQLVILVLYLWSAWFRPAPAGGMKP